MTKTKQLLAEMSDEKFSGVEMLCDTLNISLAVMIVEGRSLSDFSNNWLRFAKAVLDEGKTRVRYKEVN